MTIPSDLPLPVEAALPALLTALQRGHAVLSAPPGSGKTTRVPLALLDAGWLGGRKILVLEPRRPAARMAARYMAGRIGEPVGERVGYQIRFERRSGPRTRIEFLTEGLLTRRIQADPELSDVGLVIFDEFHERSLQADLGLALCLDLIDALRPDLRLLVMSATLNERTIADLLGAEVVRSEGGLHPVTIRWAETTPADRLGLVPRLCRQALADSEGDLLVFLPGVREINQVAEALTDCAALVDILPLHGELGAEAQERALGANPGRRRLILATDIAETSLTIPGVSVVVDSGLNRKPVFDPNSGLTRLVTRSISQASATQRAGRAGRLGPGLCYRAWSEASHGQLEAEIAPEIRNADLASLVLELAQWGVNDPDRLRWLDPPPPGNWSQAVELLQALGAIDGQGAITTEGRRMAGFGTHPRLAHLLLQGGGQGPAADLAAILSERDPLQQRERPADLRLRLRALRQYRASEPLGAGWDRRRLAAIDRLAEQFRQRTGPGEDRAEAPMSAGALLALAYPDRIALQRGGSSGRFLTAAGRGAWLPAEDALAASEFLVIAEMEAGSGDGRIRLGLPITRAELEELMAGQILELRQARWDAASESVRGVEERRLGALVLAQRNLPAPSSAECVTLLLKEIERRGPDALPWTPASKGLWRRLQLMQELDPQGGWPDPARLALAPADWLAPWLQGRRSWKEVLQLDLTQILAGLLDWPQRQRLDQWLPRSYQLPSGRELPIRYPPEGTPLLEGALQDFFGQPDTPRIADGRLVLTLQLMSPARRPLARTADLASFWRNAYTEVRKEMRGRYPKHQWPEDPTAAPPVRLKRQLPPA